MISKVTEVKQCSLNLCHQRQAPIIYHEINGNNHFCIWAKIWQHPMWNSFGNRSGKSIYNNTFLVEIICIVCIFQPHRLCHDILSIIFIFSWLILTTYPIYNRDFNASYSDEYELSTIRVHSNPHLRWFQPCWDVFRLSDLLIGHVLLKNQPLFNSWVKHFLWLLFVKSFSHNNAKTYLKTVRYYPIEV